MSETNTEPVASQPRHALRRGPMGRYYAGLIPAAAIVKQYQSAETARRGRRSPAATGDRHTTKEPA